MKIEVFGTGCKKCRQLEGKVLEVIKEMNLDAEVTKVTRMEEIMERGVYKIPALTINGELVFSGKVPSSTEIKLRLQRSQS